MAGWWLLILLLLLSSSSSLHLTRNKEQNIDWYLLGRPRPSQHFAFKAFRISHFAHRRNTSAHIAHRTSHIACSMFRRFHSFSSIRTYPIRTYRLIIIPVDPWTGQPKVQQPNSQVVKLDCLDCHRPCQLCLPGCQAAGCFAGFTS